MHHSRIVLELRILELRNFQIYSSKAETFLVSFQKFNGKGKGKKNVQKGTQDVNVCFSFVFFSKCPNAVVSPMRS